MGTEKIRAGASVLKPHATIFTTRGIEMADQDRVGLSITGRFYADIRAPIIRRVRVSLQAGGVTLVRGV